MKPAQPITAKALSAEFARLLVANGKRPIIDSPMPTTTICGVDIEYHDHEITGSLKKFSKKYLEPAALRLARYSRETGPAPGMPYGPNTYCDVGQNNGVHVRYTMAFDVNESAMKHRFDVTHA